MMLVRFNFSGYERREVPEALKELRRVLVGESITFFGLKTANVETAPIIEEHELNELLEEYDVYLANAEEADVFISYPNDKIHLLDYARSIKRIESEENVKAYGFEHQSTDDYDACTTRCFITPFYPELMITKRVVRT